MKNQLFTFIAIVVVTGIMGIATNAQTSGNRRLVANIPFEFTLGHTTLPPGDYEVSCTNPASSGKILQFRQTGGRTRVLIQTIDVVGPIKETAKLIFHRYGDRYFLAQAWMAAEGKGLSFRKSKIEKAMERNLSGAKPTAATVALNLKR